MSWAAHDLEPYAIQRHSQLKVAFVPLLIGSYAPDLMTKWFVYGIHLGPWELKATTRRSSTAAGRASASRTRSSTGSLIGLISGRASAARSGAISFLIGQWAHALTDTGDTVGTMLLFPWTFHFHLNAWAYAGQTGASPTRPRTSAASAGCGTWSGSSTGSSAGAC